MLIRRLVKTGGGQNPLKSTIEPYRSGGYINWIPVPNAKYVVKVYQKNADGSYTLLESKSTDMTYAKLNLNYLSQPGIYYNITALNNGTGATILEGDLVQPVPPDWNPFDLTCWIDCVGKTYAWKLYLGQQDDGNWDITDPGKVFLTSAVESVDYVNYTYVPYWQAISDDVYEELDLIDHPYTQSTNNGWGGYEPNYLYERIEIIEGVTPGGPFYDRQGSQVLNGWLIEKKMDQFSYMNTSATNIFNPDATFCENELSGFGGWIHTYNTHLNDATLQQIPLSTPFSNIVPTQLACDNPIGVPASPNDFLTPGEPYNYNDLVWCWTNSGNPVPDNILDASDCIELLPWVSGLEVIQIDMPNQPIIWNFNGTNQQSNINKLEKLSKGLYKVLVYTDNGKVIPLVFEQKTEHGVIRKHRDFVKLEISPNQIQNEVLKFKVSSEKNMNATIKVHSLNGTQLFLESVQLSETADLIREIPVAAIDYPYNQMRVTIEFDDNSFVQGTAIR